MIVEIKTITEGWRCEQHRDPASRAALRNAVGRGARAGRAAGGGPLREGRPPGGPAGDDGAADAAPARPDTDRRLVLRRPLRARRRRRLGRHGGPPAPAHRTADRQLAVQRRDRAPRQPRHPRAGPAGRVEPDDRRSRYQPLGGLHRADIGPARRATVGGAARRTPPRPTGLPAPRPATRRPGRRRGQGVPRHPRRRHLARPHLQPAPRRRDHPRRARGRHPGDRPPLRTRAARRPGGGAHGGDAPAPGRTRLPGTRTRHAAPREHGGHPGPHGAARRHAVRRTDRDVVELHRTVARRDRAGPRGLDEGQPFRRGPGLRRRSAARTGAAERAFETARKRALTCEIRGRTPRNRDRVCAYRMSWESHGACARNLSHT
ncbi:putative Pirin [Streptomyces misionensis JCM 4497]